MQRLEEVKSFWKQINSKNFFDLSSSEIKMSLMILRGNNQIPLDALQAIFT